MLAARIDDRLLFAYPDRSLREVFRFEVPSNGSLSASPQLIARGDWVAVQVMVRPLGPTSTLEPFIDVVVVSVRGEVRFHKRYPFDYDGAGSDTALVGNASGLFVLSALELKAGLGVVINGDTDASFTQKMAARSDPDALGRLLVADYEDSSTQAFHFFDTRTGTFTLSRYWMQKEAGKAASSAAALGAGVLSFARAPDRLVYEEPDRVRELSVDGLLEADDHPSAGWQHSGGWVLFQLGGSSPQTARYLAAHFASGELRLLQLKPPAPWSLPADFWNEPPIDSLGQVIVPLSNGSTHQMFATRDGSSWEPVGKPVTASNYPFPTRWFEGGGAVSFKGHGGGNGPVPGALASNASQLVGPQGGNGIELVRHDGQGGLDNPSYADDVISADGRCMAYFKNGSVHVVETATYAITDLGLVAHSQSAEMVWVPQ